MKNHDIRLDGLMRKIKKAGPMSRFKLQPQLDRLIHTMEQEGARVDSVARRLNTELRDEAIEAQFENMPV